MMLPTTDICGCRVTRLILGGNPFSGFSHQSPEMDWEMIRFYTMPRLQEALDTAWRNGINTFASRTDHHIMRMYVEHRERGGQLQWFGQVASEFRDIPKNASKAARYGAAAIYHQGTDVDNRWHSGRIDEIRDIVKAIKDQGLPAGIATHIPEVIEYAEEHGWETDFYAGCFYNLARGYKLAPAVERDAYQRDRFPESDPPRMVRVLRQVSKPCIGYKILAAGRKCGDDEQLRSAFAYALENLKPIDCVAVGAFQRDTDQIARNAAIVREWAASRV